MKGIILTAFLGWIATTQISAQQKLETGALKPMPNEWIDNATGHKVIKLSRVPGENSSFYFHNNPFFGNKMVFYNSPDSNVREIYTVDLKTLKTEQVTNLGKKIGAEVVNNKNGDVYFQSRDSVFAVNIETKVPKLIYVFPSDFKASISTLNADGSILAGRYSDGNEEKEILKKYPEKSQFFNRIFDAKLPNYLFTINIKTGELKKIHQENTWLGHVQFSPTDPNLLMFCHEGPWQKVDRIWTINIASKELKKMHSRTMDMEIAGHEFFSPDGKIIWFDHQKPKGEKFYLTGADVKTGKERTYELTRNEWSIHFNISKDQKLFAGDGGDAGQVAKAEDGRWIYLFKPNVDRFTSERLVNMKAQGYKLEPNVHFSPDGKWVIFRANFEGQTQVYAVEIEKR